MLHVIIKMIPGKNEEVKIDLAGKAHNFLAEELHPAKEISIPSEDIRLESMNESMEKISAAMMYIRLGME